jgi:hypothetical protein
MMLEELERRSYSQNTVRTYLMTIEDFARYFHKSPDSLGPELPPGFVRIRHFGFLAHRRRRTSLPLCAQLLAAAGRTAAPTAAEEKAASSPRPLWTCPQCGGPMVLMERFSAFELRLRSPPTPAAQQL